MQDPISKIIVLLALITCLFVILRLIGKVIRNKYAPVKSVHATIIDKTKIDTFSKYSGKGKTEKYVVIFSANGKKLSFYVSEFSYRGYKIKDTGTLKYKGDRIIDFH